MNMEQILERSYRSCQLAISDNSCYFNNMRGTVVTARTATCGVNAEARIVLDEDVNLVDYPLLEKMCMNGFGSVHDNSGVLQSDVVEDRNAFLIYTTEFIERRIGERIAKFLGENFVHTISLHTGPLSNPRMRAVCQGLRHLVLWSRPKPYPLWACWATYLWGCIQYHD